MNPTPPHGPGDGMNAAVAAVLRGERESAHITYEELGKRTGISPRTLKRLMSSVERDIDVNVLASLGEAFNMTPAQVMERAEEWQRRQGA